MTRLPKLGLPLLFIFAAVVGSSQLFAQAGNIQYQVANLVEDVRMLDERMRQMSIQLEEMRRENSRLRQLVDDYESKADGQLSKFVTAGQLNESIRKSVAALEKRDDLMKDEIIVGVKKSMEDMLKKLGGSIAGANTTSPKPRGKTYFPKEGIPELGVPYTVAPGDTLSGIAKKLNSRMDWIQNRNEISDPSLLQVGQVILVPQEAE